MRFCRMGAINLVKGEKMTVGAQIRRRRKELKMSVDELARRIGKDRSTVYRYENGDIGNMPVEVLPSMIEALETTPQELLSSIVAASESLSKRAEKWFDATEGYEFNDDEMSVFYEMAKYLMSIRNSANYAENLNCLFTLFKQLNKAENNIS